MRRAEDVGKASVSYNIRHSVFWRGSTSVRVSSWSTSARVRVATDTRADGAGRTLDYRHLPRSPSPHRPSPPARPRPGRLAGLACDCRVLLRAYGPAGPGQPRPDEARRRARHRAGAWRRTSSPRAQGRLTTAPATDHPSASSAETYRIRPTPSCRLMERAPSRPRPRTCGPRAWRALRSTWQRSRRIKGGSRSGGRMVAI